MDSEPVLDAGSALDADTVTDSEMVTDAPTERLAVLGSPIAHSRSPQIHAAAYRELGLAWSYGRQELQAAELGQFLESHRSGWRGFSLTMPLKEEAHKLSALLDPVATESGVVNTLLRLDSEHQPWAGFNTDVGGLAAAIAQADLDASDTVVLGAGATAVSAVLAARAQGAQRITVAARRKEAAAAIADRFGVTAITLTRDELQRAALSATLIISTVPGSVGHDLELPREITEIPLFDVAYDPWPSPLSDRWTSAGGESHAGTAMLVEQAVLQLRIFVGGNPAAIVPGEDRALAAMRAAASTGFRMG